MGYKVIYLDGEEGRPKKNCKICEELERNVIEPVAIFLAEGKNLTDLPDEELEKFDTCIFHCEKENEIWMKNLEEYKEWKKRRDEANAEGEKFNEDFQIEWRENLVNEFWNRLRAYRFAIDYWEEWKGTEEDWYKFIQSLKDKIKNDNKTGEDKTLKEIKIHETFIARYFSALKRAPEEYNFGKFKFPFDSENFWYKGETSEFIKKTNFSETYFYQKADFCGAQFYQGADFRKAQFSQEANFKEAEFSGADFSQAQFHQGANFRKVQFFLDVNFWKAQFFQEICFNEAKFYIETDFSWIEFHQETSFEKAHFFLKADFSWAQFHQWANFSGAQFHQKANFNKAKFHQEADLNGTQFHHKTDFSQAQFHLEASFSGVQFHQEADFSASLFKENALFNLKGTTLKFKLAPRLTEESQLEVRNLKAHIVEIDELTNTTKNSLFFDCSLITNKEYKEGQINLFKEEVEELMGNLMHESKDKETIANDTEKLKKLLKLRIKADNLQVNKLREIIKSISQNKIRKELLTALMTLENSIEKAGKTNKDPNLLLNNSIFGELRFINCDFSKGKIEIKNSDLTDIKIANVNWGEISEKRICRELFEKEPEKTRDVYRQLKLAHDNQKDHITANAFFALEMKAHERVLYKDICKNKSQILIFTLHRAVSNFGQSWIKPLILLLLITAGYAGFTSSGAIQNLTAQPKASALTLLLITLLLCLLTTAVIIAKLDRYELPPFIEFTIWMFLSLFGFFGFYFLMENFIQNGLLSALSSSLDSMAKKLNLFNRLKPEMIEKGNHTLENHAFIETLYFITTSFLIYQIIVAVRRQVRR